MFWSQWTIIREQTEPSQSYHWIISFLRYTFGVVESCFRNTKSVTQKTNNSVVTLARLSLLPDDGPLGPKHVGVLIF